MAKNHKSPLASNDASVNSNELAIISQQKVLDKNFVVYGTFENPLFLAKDVAEWIEHSNHKSMIELVDSDEKIKINLKEGNNAYPFLRDEAQWFLTEDGLYEVLMQSRKPIAKSFKKEVKKILKELRIKGYLPPHDDFPTKLEGPLKMEIDLSDKKVWEIIGCSENYADRINRRISIFNDFHYMSDDKYKDEMIERSVKNKELFIIVKFNFSKNKE